MKRLKGIFMSLAALLMIGSVWAQAERTSMLPTSQLTTFNSLRVDGEVELTLIQVEDSLPARIEYDLGDNPADKFKFSVKTSGELQVSQARNTKSVSRVKATLYYHTLDLLRLSYADVTLSTPLRSKISNIILENGAKLSGDVECMDLELTLNTDSRAEIEGVAKYLTLRVGSGTKSELRGLDVTSARVDASQGAITAITTGERLDVSVATRSVVKYWGTPEVLRIRKPLLGGELLQVEE